MRESWSSDPNTSTALKAYRDVRFTDKKIARLAALVCIANVEKAFEGLIPRKKIIRAIGNANTPNAVSRAVRFRLPRI